jgi:hypothetical protein
MSMLHLLAALMPKGAAPTLSWTFVGSCQSTGTTLDFSALSAGSIQANDVALYIDYAGAADPPTAVTPSGFTNVINTASVTSEPGARAMVSWKKLAGSEGSVTGMSASTGGSGADNNKIGLVFRPSIDFTTMTFSTPQNSGIIDSNPAAITVDPSAETIPVVLIGIGATYQGTVTFSTASPAFDAQINLSDNDMRVGYKIYNSSPLSHSIDINDLGSANWLAGFYFEAV